MSKLDNREVLRIFNLIEINLNLSDEFCSLISSLEEITEIHLNDIHSYYYKVNLRNHQSYIFHIEVTKDKYTFILEIKTSKNKNIIVYSLSKDKNHLILQEYDCHYYMINRNGTWVKRQFNPDYICKNRIIKLNNKNK